jgi:SAM-dependent methyltransferase
VPEREWFQNAFEEFYEDLYSHRDREDARRAVEFVLRHSGPLDSNDRVLDLCCGPGRHTSEWIERGGKGEIVGFDLSPTQLGLARQALHGRAPLVRGDMRRLPFANGSMHLVLNLFTSFGYFDSEDENASVFREVARALASGGALVFDHMNPSYLRSHLRAESERTTPGGWKVSERRAIDTARRRVEKRTRIVRENESHDLFESVRFYEPEEVETMARAVGLSVHSVFGDWDDSAWTADSPRAIYWIGKE